MTKSKAILICIIIILIFSTILYFNYDGIVNYISNKSWEMAGSVATITTEQTAKIVNLGDNLVVIGSDGIVGYGGSEEKSFTIEGSFKDVLTDSSREYCVIGEKSNSKVYLLYKSNKTWDVTISGQLFDVSVNKNGYVSVIYSQSGYKSLIKVLKPNGEELFTNYLASTYAIESQISNDNKSLAIAEVNTEGIKVSSTIKIISIDKISEENVKIIELAENILVTDIKYDDKNELWILSNNRINKIDKENNLLEIVTYNYNDVILASISNGERAIIVRNASTGVFDNKYVVEIYETNEKFNTYELSDIPSQIYTQNKIIAIDVGDEILFINTNGKLVKRCEVKGKVKSVQLYSNGGMAGIELKDRIELIKL